jgi:hypothetical protein
MIPGIHPRITVPLMWTGLACYDWLLVAGRHHSGRSWWFLALTAVVLVVGVVLAVRQWGHYALVADTLAGRVEPEPPLAEEVDRVARQVDDAGPWSAVAGSVAFVLVLVGTGLDRVVRDGRWILLVPMCGLALVGVAMVAVRRRRRQDVARWLAFGPTVIIELLPQTRADAPVRTATVR